MKPRGPCGRLFAGLILALLLFVTPCLSGEPAEASADEQARVAELQRRIECQEARIRQLEAQAAEQEDGEVLIPFIKIQARFGPNLRYWRDRLWEAGGGTANK